MSKPHVLIICQTASVPPENAVELAAAEQGAGLWRPVHDVRTTLRAHGYRVTTLGIDDELAPIRRSIQLGKPDLVFNLVEAFMGVGAYDQHVASYLELLRIPYTGCGPRGLTLARDKALSKKILAYHRIRVPAFQTFPMGRRLKRRASLAFPLIVKSLSEDASYGISKASLVTNDEKLRERGDFIHETIGTDAIVERFIDGRELYSSVLGNRRRTVFPTWELTITGRSEGEPLIATEKAKFDVGYQTRKGVFHQPAEGLPPELEKRISRLGRRICRVLDLDGYARVDYRLGEDGELYFIEANPNPDITSDAEFAASAALAGVDYPRLLSRIIRLGQQRRPAHEPLEGSD
ncbi:MAG: D-alanine--D-alanine ligase family protein [Planctomycetota bacterium]